MTKDLSGLGLARLNFLKEQEEKMELRDSEILQARNHRNEIEKFIYDFSSKINGYLGEFITNDEKAHLRKDFNEFKQLVENDINEPRLECMEFITDIGEKVLRFAKELDIRLHWVQEFRQELEYFRNLVEINATELSRIKDAGEKTFEEMEKLEVLIQTANSFLDLMSNKKSSQSFKEEVDKVKSERKNFIMSLDEIKSRIN